MSVRSRDSNTQYINIYIYMKICITAVLLNYEFTFIDPHGKFANVASKGISFHI